MESLGMQVFDAENPDTKDACVTCSGDADGYVLRKRIACDAVEYKGTFDSLVKAWSRGLEPAIPAAEPGVAPERAATGETAGEEEAETERGAGKGVRKKPAKPDCEVCRFKSNAMIDASSL